MRAVITVRLFSNRYSSTGKNIEAKLSEKEMEIQTLKHRDSMNTDAIASLSDKMQELMLKVQELEKLRH
jgi:septation ring formation regulator EzrA